MIKLTILSALLLTFGASAAEIIEGAFGLKLGADFDPATAIGKTETTAKVPMYQFEPTKPYPAFNRYYVLVTPKTKKIYCIWGIGPTENPQICEREQKVLMAALNEKYGASEKKGFGDALANRALIRTGTRSVSTECSSFTQGVIEIRYTDLTLQETAEAERLEEDASKVDKTGL